MYQIYEPRYSMQDTKWGDIALPGDKVQYIQTNNGVCVCVCVCSLGEGSDHSRKRPALVTNHHSETPFELFLKLCNQKLS